MEMQILPSEALLVWRRRIDITQKALAQRWGVTQPAIVKMEKGKLAVPEAREQEIAIQHNFDELQPHEQGILLRRRIGASQQTIAEKRGVSRITINDYENGRARVPKDYVAWLFLLINGAKAPVIK